MAKNAAPKTHQKVQLKPTLLVKRVRNEVLIVDPDLDVVVRCTQQIAKMIHYFDQEKKRSFVVTEELERDFLPARCSSEIAKRKLRKSVALLSKLNLIVPETSPAELPKKSLTNSKTHRIEGWGEIILS